ncbi:hypothetical protein BDA99DRAFT_535209 [Phascolomyces articulosus]|uniref:Uncharacterized protein n=1 Tax=Phascolomyces articulosus TaxID=60185 RepID=A0AAD5PGF9_9FUNG|nr:hypothetical protein BDA99DRAFT_535209 [Phascolomyces articulosus]
MNIATQKFIPNEIKLSEFKKKGVYYNTNGFGDFDDIEMLILRNFVIGQLAKNYSSQCMHKLVTKVVIVGLAACVASLFFFLVFYSYICSIDKLKVYKHIKQTEHYCQNLDFSAVTYIHKL